MVDIFDPEYKNKGYTPIYDRATRTIVLPELTNANDKFTVDLKIPSDVLFMSVAIHPFLDTYKLYHHYPNDLEDKKYLLGESDKTGLCTVEHTDEKIRKKLLTYTSAKKMSDKFTVPCIWNAQYLKIEFDNTERIKNVINWMKSEDRSKWNSFEDIQLVDDKITFKANILLGRCVHIKDGQFYFRW